MLEKLHSYLQVTLAGLVEGLLETVTQESKMRMSNKRRRIILEGPEALESRITPSTVDSWTGSVSGDWSNPANWTDADGAHVVPTSNSDVVFGQPGTNVDCTMSVPGGATVNTLTIGALYGTHTLTLNTSLNTNGLDMEGGNISQPNGTGSTVSCSGPLNWTTGTIGSQTNSASSFILNNELSTISGSGVKTLGDNLSLTGVLEITGDTGNQVRLANNAYFTNYGTLWLQGGGLGIANASGSQGYLINFETVEATEATGSNLQCVPVVNNGQFIVGDQNKTATVLEIQDSNPQNGVSFLNNGGTAKIYTGAQLLAQKGFTQQRGTLDIAGTSGNAYINWNATTNDKVIINGGNVTYDTPDDFLFVGWDFTMIGGNLTLTVDATNGNWNTITSNAGNINFANGSTVTVNTVNIPAGGMPQQQWGIFYTSDNFGLKTSVSVDQNVIWSYNGFDYTTGYTADHKEFYLES